MDENSLFKFGNEIKNLFNASRTNAAIDKKSIDRIISNNDISEDQFISIFLEILKQNSYPAVSDYRVSAAVLTANMNIYTGANIEFPSLSPQFTVHAEQAAVANALNNGESHISELWVSDLPCGMCLQFLSEQKKSKNLIIKTADGKISELRTLLTQPFSMEAKESGKNAKFKAINNSENELINRAISASQMSVAPITDFYAGAALQTSSANIYTGFYLENISFNTSLLPVQMALASLLAGEEKPEDIVKSVLVQTGHQALDFEQISDLMLKSICKSQIIFEKLNKEGK